MCNGLEVAWRLHNHQATTLDGGLLMNGKILWQALPAALLALQLAGCLTEGEVDGSSPPDQVSNPDSVDDNQAPSISGQPATNATAGETYSFTPVASDPDGDRLTFSVQNAPPWASFDASNGRLSGRPGSGDIGIHSSVVIGVSDGEKSDSLAAFSIEVTAQGEEPPPAAPPPHSGDYVGFGSATQGAGSCPSTPATYRVTSLSGGSGSGTLRDAVSEDCRHIVFDVGGEISLGDLQISNSYLTIDGSTAPAPGITLTNVGRLVLEASSGRAVHDVIVNNIRAIGGGGSEETNDLWELDGSSGAPIYNVVLDHLTMSRSADGNVDIYGDVHDVTLSNSLIMDSIQGQHFSQSGGLRERLTIYNNVYYGVNERQPRIRYDTRQLDFVNNVVYGWGWFEGGAAGMHLEIGGFQYSPSANIENNVYYYVSGLAGDQDDALQVDGTLYGDWYFAGNVWPSGESTGDDAGNSGRISMGGFEAPRAPANQIDVQSAGTHFPTAEEQQRLADVALAINGSAPAPAACDDGVDNDGDGLADFPSDPGCSQSSDNDESDDAPAPPPPPPSPPPPPGNEIARNIPHPADFFGWDPLTFDPPTTQTVSSVPSSVSAGSSILVTGTGGSSVTFNCTSSAPCLLKSTGVARSSGLAVSGSHFVVDGFVFQGDDTESVYVSGANFGAVRNVEHGGTNSRTGNGTSMLHWIGSDMVYYNNHIHNIARNDGSEEVDYMGLSASRGSRIWFIGNHVHEVGGDSLKLGQNVSRAEGQFPTEIYVTGNRFYGNGENPIDIKWSRDIWIVDNELYGVSSSVSSSGEAIVIHESGDYVHILDNYIHDVSHGVETATSGGGASYIEVDGNTFDNMAIGVYNRGGGHADVTNNTFADVGDPIVTNTGNGSTTTASGNN